MESIIFLRGIKALALVPALVFIAFVIHSDTARAAKSCPLPWGGSIADGTSIIAWNFPSPPPGLKCRSEIRWCTDGFLSGSFPAIACKQPARFLKPFDLPPIPAVRSL